MKKENKVKNQIRKVFSSYFGPGYTGQLNLDIIIKIIRFYEKEKIGSNKISERLKLENKLSINQGIIGRILTKAKENKLVRAIPRKELTFSIEQKKYQDIKLRKIHNEIREITDFDRKQNSYIPENARYRIVFSTPQGQTTKIPEELQGVQYFKTIELAEIALEQRLSSNFLTTNVQDRTDLKRERDVKYYEKLKKDKKRFEKKQQRDRQSAKERWKNISQEDWELKKQRDREYQAKRKERLN